METLHGQETSAKAERPVPRKARLTRGYHFCAAHRLHLEGLSEEENYRIYGKCNNPFGHGHNYHLLVTVEGEPDAATGVLVPVEALDAFVHREVVERYDHKDLNTQVPEFAQVPSTTERVAEAVVHRLTSAWPAEFFSRQARLAHIRIEETKRNFIDLPVAQEFPARSL